MGPLVVDAAGIRSGHRVLDVACGTGILAREAARHSGNDGRVVGLDAGPGMLAVAERLAPTIDWRHGVAESLPYDDSSFDAVVSQFGLMFFQDRTEALREMERVLCPGGRMAVAVWGSLEHTEAYPVVVRLLERLAGEQAANALRAPFVLGDLDELSALFRDGWASPVEIATHHGTARFPSIRTMVEAELRGWLPVMGIVLAEQQIKAILDGAEQALAQYVTAEGTVEFAVPASIVAATKR